MGWFDKQIRKKKAEEQAAFEESFRQIAGAVMGKIPGDSGHDSRKDAEDAIGEILRYYRIKPKEVPENLQDTNEVLEFLLRSSGILRRSVKLEKGWRKDAFGAMLGIRKDDGSIVALIPYGLAGYRFFDRKTGRYVRVTGRNEDLIEADASAFYKPFPLKKMNIVSFGRYLLQQISVSDMAALIAAMAAVTQIGRAHV